MDREFLEARIEKCKAMIIAYEDAITALVTEGVKSYTLNTGQTVQTVQEHDLASLQKSLDGLYNRCATLEARLNGTGTITGFME
jgi:hypothetical protein